MRVKVTKSKNAESFYIIKSFRDKATGKSTSKVVEKLGTRKELEERLGPGADVEAWARERARELTQAEKERTRCVIERLDPNARLEKGVRKTFVGGYLFLQKIYHELALDKACADIAERHSFAFDLDAVLSRLVYGRVLEPASKASTCQFARRLIEGAGFEGHQVYRALGVLAKESDFIQAALYEASAKMTPRKTKILYYDCTNFFFEIEQEDDFRKYGPSKQHQPSPLVQMGLFMDADGMPLAFCTGPGSQNEQATLIPLEKRIMDDFSLSKFVVCTDAGLSSSANRMFNSAAERQFITTQSVKTLKGHLKDWALDASGWHASGTDKTFDLNAIEAIIDDETTDEHARRALLPKVFYKQRMVKEKVKGGSEPFEQRLVVTFSFKHRAYARRIRQTQIEQAARDIERGAAPAAKKRQNDYKRFVSQSSVTEDGEVASKAILALDTARIAEEERYDGFYGLATSLDGEDIEGILKVNSQRWEIEECFRIMKTEFKARPVYLSRKDRIRAHFLTCFIALLVFRILEKRLHGKYTCTQIIEGLRSMDFKEVRGEGYEPLYERTDFTDDIHDAFGFRTDYEIVTNRTMKEIIRKTKGR